ncbi:HAD domain-containing protein [Pelomonas nitida]|uniref:HAD domain-containing protein n=1 Tax=Pelomonas nitida TaxID=3299027 RepID=A0ABW7G8W5_9BURK
MQLTCFLNLEGVVHPVATEYRTSPPLPHTSRPFLWADALREVSERLDIHYVLRTSVLLHVPMPSLVELAPAWLRARLVGTTAHCLRYVRFGEAPRRVASRRAVIRRYVDEHRLKHWVALDDNADGWLAADPELPRLVLCDAKLGVSDSAAITELHRALQWSQEAAAGK